MNHLSGLDALFLHVESAEMPMHVGSLHVLRLPDGYAGDFFQNVKAFIAERLHLAAVFTRKLALMPFELSDPVWVDDDDVELDYHVRHVTLPGPGSNAQLQQVVARLHSMLLDRSRPLWEIHLIDGLRSGEVAIYAKLHHAGLDGQAGIELGRAIFDAAPAGRRVKPPRARTRRATPPLGAAEMLRAAVTHAGHQYVKLLNLLPILTRAWSRTLPPLGAADTLPGGRLTPLASLAAPRTPLNVAITNQRRFAGRTVPVAQVKQIARHFDASFNDVVLATTAGALRRYLADGNELPARSMTAAVPVSLREQGDTTANNQVGMLTVALATDEPDPIARLRRIRDGSRSAKSAADPFRSAIPMDFPLFAAPWLVSGLAAAYGRSRLADWTPPPANLVISNVAGVQAPLYFAGAEVVSYYPVSIATHGMALNVTVTSYNGRLDYGLIACRRALPDLNELGDYLLAEHRQLLALATATAPTADETAAAPPPRPRPRPRPPIRSTPGATS